MSLVSLVDMKTYLGITGTDDDAFLTEQLELISSVVESYCGRIFTGASYTQTFYSDEMPNPVTELFLFHYPVTTLTTVERDGEDISDEVRLHAPTGRLRTATRKLLFKSPLEKIEVTYSAGFSTIPAIIQSVVKSLVEERYNKRKAGVDLNFGRDVQSISIPGTISVTFDYTLQANERGNRFGMVLGDYANMLDYYRSERAVIGEIRTNYVE